MPEAKDVCPWCGVAHKTGPCPAPGEIHPEGDHVPDAAYVKASPDDMGPWMAMNSGARFFVLEPRAEPINFDDIAHHCARICRFGGAPDEHYSVAQHCLLVTIYLRDHGSSPEQQLAGLLHDGAEAFYGDPISPVKWGKLIPALTIKMQETQSVIMEAVGLPPDAYRWDVVQEADQVLKHAEARDLFNKPAWCDAKVAAKFPAKVVPWDAATAKDRFKKAFSNLRAQIK